jgi:hypothetical protein
LKPLVCEEEAENLADDWAEGQKRAIKKVDKLLASAGLTMDAVMAETLAINLDAIERIDRMIAAAEARRHDILREIERHRATWDQSLRRSAQQAEDVEFKVVEDKSSNKSSDVPDWVMAKKKCVRLMRKNALVLALPALEGWNNSIDARRAPQVRNRLIGRG